MAENEAVLKDLFAQSSDRHQTDPKACLKDKTPLRITEFQRDTLGRLIASIAHDQQGGTQETLFQYDAEGRLVRAADPHSITGFDYDANGRILQESFRFHRPEVDQSNALPLTDWRNPDHDLILQHTHRNVRYVYDANGNRTATHLPNGQRLDYLYS